MRSVLSPEQPGPPAAECVAAGKGCLLPERQGCTGSAGSLLARFGNLWLVFEKVPSWPGSAGLWSARKEKRRKERTDTFNIQIKHLILVPYEPACALVRSSVSVLTTTASAVAPSALMTAGAVLITAVVRGVCTLLPRWANSGCFFLMCCTILV